MFKLIRSSILAGIAIGCGAFGFLASGVQSESYGQLFGAILFSFGLITVVAYKLSLYTGTAGFIKKNELGKLFIILGGNIVGCFIMGLVSRVSHLPIHEAAQNVLSLRIERGPLPQRPFSRRVSDRCLQPYADGSTPTALHLQAIRTT